MAAESVTGYYFCSSLIGREGVLALPIQPGITGPMS